MPRFIIAHRFAGTRSSSLERSLHSFNNAVLKMRAFADVASTSKAGSKSARGMAIVDVDANEIKAREQSFSPDIIIEPEMMRVPARLWPTAGTSAAAHSSAMPAGNGAALKLSVACEGTALARAKVALTLTNVRTYAGSTVQGETDQAGTVSLPYDPVFWAPVSIIVMPLSAAWSWLVPASDPEVKLNLPALPKTGPLGWWHYALNAIPLKENSGKGIRVGVADTGLAQHPYLTHARPVGAFINGNHDASPGSSDDTEDHGTHVAGIIGARPPQNSRGFSGVAPGVDLFCARVYPSPAESRPGGQAQFASNGDVAIAIDALVNEHNVDLINLSLGGLQSSQVELDAIQAAVEAGTLVICSAGNESGGPVTFPAGYAQSIAVSAIGVPWCCPQGGLDASTMPTQIDRFSFTGAYSPNFISVGPAINCVGPGVGIISTVPGAKDDSVPYAAMSGTSMAAPAVCAMLASLLSNDEVYRGMPRDVNRTMRAAMLLMQSTRDLGLAAQYQGSGLPSAPG